MNSAGSMVRAYEKYWRGKAAGRERNLPPFYIQAHIAWLTLMLANSFAGVQMSRNSEHVNEGGIH